MSALEERIKELGFSEEVLFTAENKSKFPSIKNIGVYIIRSEKPSETKTGKSNIFKIGEGVITKRFKKYLWSKSYGSTAKHIRTLMDKEFKSQELTAAWVECDKQTAEEIEIELLCMFHVENKQFPPGNKGCK